MILLKRIRWGESDAGKRRTVRLAVQLCGLGGSGSFGSSAADDPADLFDWIKTSSGIAKIKLRGRARVNATFTMALAAYNLIRLPKLLRAAA